MFFEPPWARGGAAADCIQHKNLAGLGVLCMILFSICVQAAEGLHYGIVPYVSRPALGVVSGMVGAGGNLGAVISSMVIVGPDVAIDEGIVTLGYVTLGASCSLMLFYMPEWGGMFFKPGALGSYDPQLIKPPADMGGADQLDYAAAETTTTKPAQPAVAVSSA